MRRGNRLGRSIRGAFATPGLSRRAKGTGAPARRLAGAALAACGIVLFATSLAGASKGVHDYFGTQGSGNGQFQTPVGIAVNETGAGAANPGDVYVVDNGNGRIERFDADGAYLSQFGSPGTAAGQLSGPRGIAVDQQTGDLYVMETEGLRVSKFDAAGNFILMFGRDVDSGGGTEAEVCTVPANCQTGAAGTAGGELEFAGSRSGFPSVVPAGAPGAGNVLLADQANHRVQEFTSSGAFVRTFGWDVNAPDGDEAFEECTVAAECLAGDTAEENLAAGQFERFGPRRVVADSSGAIYTVEEVRVQKFTPQAGPPALNPEGAFDPADLTGQSGAFAISDIQIGASDHVFAVRRFQESEASTCPDGSTLPRESRILEVNSSGALQATYMACARIDSVEGFGLNASSGAMYLSSTEPESRIYLLDDVAPPTVTALPATDVTTTSATLHATLNPGGDLPGDQTFYRFELSADGGATWTPLLPTSTDAGTGTSDIPLDRPTVGLDPNTEYRYRIFAFKAFGNSPIASAPATFTTGAAAPGLSIATTTASEHGAVLRSRVNPHSQATTYRYEYGATESYGSTTANASAGSGAKALIAAAPISGLHPESTYHYRVLATNASGTTTGPDRTVVSGEGRAWEMVSPVQKEGADVMTEGGRTRASTDGNAIQFLSLGAFGDARGTGISTEFMATRDQGGWQTHALTPLHAPRDHEDAANAFDPRYIGELSDDLSTGVYVSQTPLATGAPNVAAVKNLYLRRDLHAPGNGTYELLSPSSAPVTEPQAYQPAFAGASADFSHVVFTSRLNLTPDAPPQGFFCVLAGFGCEERAYEHTPAGVRLVGKVPVPPATSCTGVDCVPAVHSMAGQKPGSGYYGFGAISDDGSRVVFMVGAAATSPEGDIYLREGDTTTQVNASEPGVPLSGPAHFADASADGSKLFFTSNENAYRYDLDAPQGARLTLLSADEEPGDSTGSVGAIYGISEDGERAYFSDTSQLVSGAPLARSGNDLLFSWHNGDRGFVGAVTPFDESFNAADQPARQNRFARVTPDGSHLLFVSGSPSQPTGEQSAQCDGRPCWRAYVYDADANDGAGALACASCRPAGGPATSNVNYVPRVGTGGAQTEQHLNQALTDDGHFALFSTADPLVPEDSNGRYDVYAYDIRSAQVILLSSGNCNCDSWFLDASADGRDVFFTTREQLVGWDVDQANDLYDARLGGGFPEPASPPPTCQGDACQPPPALLTRPSLATSTSKGSGNPLRARACPKGKRRVSSRGKSRCVAKKAKKQHNRKHRANRNRRVSR